MKYKIQGRNLVLNVGPHIMHPLEVEASSLNTKIIVLNVPTIVHTPKIWSFPTKPQPILPEHLTQPQPPSKHDNEIVQLLLTNVFIWHASWQYLTTSEAIKPRLRESELSYKVLTGSYITLHKRQSYLWAHQTHRSVLLHFVIHQCDKPDY